MRTPSPGADRRWRAAAFASLVLAIGLGVWARVRGLGVSPLSTDEYYFVRSIEQIMQHGVPVFETGGFYTRGILVQYLTVPWMLLLDSAELAVRIPSVAFGLAAAWVSWHFGKRSLGPRFAVALVLMVLLSSWQVEFSRFGRMYAGFQLATLAMLVVWYDGVSDGRGRRLYWIPALCLVALLTHQLALLLVPLIFVPLAAPGFTNRIGGRKAAVRYVVAAILVASFAGAIQMVDFRGLGVADPFPAGYSSRPGSLLLLPYFPFWSLSSDSLVNVMLLSAALGFVATAGAFLVHRGRLKACEVVASLMLLAALAHQLVLAVLFAMVLIFRYRLYRLPVEEHRATIVAAAATLVAAAWALFALWLTYGLGSRAWIEAGGFELLREAAAAAFLWPNPWPAVVEPWIRDLPLIATLVGVSLAIQFVLEARRPIARWLRNPALIIAYLMLVLGILEPTFREARYTFFVYPVALAVMILSVKDIGRLLARRISAIRSGAYVAIPGVALAFGLSSDFDLQHLLNVSSREVVFRQGDFEHHEGLWYPRDDVVGPARFVTERAAGDSVIVQEAPEVSYYLDRSHALYLARDRFRFPNVSRERGTVDFWSGLRLLGTKRDIAAYTSCADRVWVVRMSADDWIPIEDAWSKRLRQIETVHTGIDGAVEVLRVDLSASSC